MTERVREIAYGEEAMTWVDRLGVWLSKRAVVGLMPRDRKPTLLDIGCGYEAKLLRQLAASLAQGVGVDVHISEAAKRTAGLRFVEAPIEQALPGLSAETFDLILMINVLEHLFDPQAVLTTVRKLLSPGGKLVINVPNWMGKAVLEFSAFRLGMSPAREMDDHKMYYSKRDLWPLLVRAGFRPSGIRMRYHKLGLNLFAVARAGEADER